MKTESETTGNLDSQQADPNEHDSKSLIPRHLEHIQSQSQRIIAASNPLRRGKWTPEEEAYALAAIRDFNSGFLDAPPGTTLRTYLSEKLQCDPMRITKKFTGEASIGKKVFHPTVRDDPTILKNIGDSQANLEHLYQKWKHRLESQDQEMARKSMAAAAVSAASTLFDNPNLPLFSTGAPSHLLHGLGCMRVPREVTNTINANKVNVLSARGNTDVTKTARWLDRADALLAKKSENNQLENEIKEEMRAISHLIKGAPEILAISADLPKHLGSKSNIEPSVTLQTPIHKLHSCPDLRILCTSSDMEHTEQSVSTPTTGKRKRSLSVENLADSPNAPMKLLASLSSQAAPVPITARHDGVNNEAGPYPSAEAIPNHHVNAEDAKTFVNAMQKMLGHFSNR